MAEVQAERRSDDNRIQILAIGLDAGNRGLRGPGADGEMLLAQSVSPASLAQ